jgi:hypothetical protein
MADFCRFFGFSRLMGDVRSASVARAVSCVDAPPYGYAPVDHRGGAAPLSPLSAIPIPIAQSAAGFGKKAKAEKAGTVPAYASMIALRGARNFKWSGGVGGLGAAERGAATKKSGAKSGRGQGSQARTARHIAGDVASADIAGAVVKHGRAPAVRSKGSVKLGRATAPVNG